MPRHVVIVSLNAPIVSPTGVWRMATAGDETFDWLPDFEGDVRCLGELVSSGNRIRGCRTVHTPSDALEDHSNTLSTANTHGGQSVLATDPLQLVHRFGGDKRT
jgi:hypothetical protein